LLPAKFAMVIAPASIPAAPQPDDEAAKMAARIASGPGLWTDWLAELDRQGLLEELLAEDVIARALREAPSGHVAGETLRGVSDYRTRQARRLLRPAGSTRETHPVTSDKSRGTAR
jgi:hypothetical protein